MRESIQLLIFVYMTELRQPHLANDGEKQYAFFTYKGNKIQNDFVLVVGKSCPNYVASESTQKGREGGKWGELKAAHLRVFQTSLLIKATFLLRYCS